MKIHPMAHVGAFLSMQIPPARQTSARCAKSDDCLGLDESWSGWWAPSQVKLFEGACLALPFRRQAFNQRTINLRSQCNSCKWHTSIEVTNQAAITVGIASDNLSRSIGMRLLPSGVCAMAIAQVRGRDAFRLGGTGSCWVGGSSRVARNVEIVAAMAMPMRSNRSWNSVEHQ